MRKFTGPVSSAIFTVIITVCFGLILSLIIAAILKRPKAAGAVPPPVS
jgi:hypothetical protein